MMVFMLTDRQEEVKWLNVFAGLPFGEQRVMAILAALVDAAPNRNRPRIPSQVDAYWKVCELGRMNEFIPLLAPPTAEETAKGKSATGRTMFS